MKSIKFKINKKKKITQTKKFKQELNEILIDCFDDIRPYILKDILNLLKKKRIIYVPKRKKK